jgi:hypothetical protein
MISEEAFSGVVRKRSKRPQVGTSLNRRRPFTTISLCRRVDRGFATATPERSFAANRPVDGTGNNYAVYVVENGDKFFVHSTLVAQSSGGGKLTATVSGVITGGTGKLSGISGTVQSVTQADPKAGFNENQSDIDYAIGK